MTDWRCIENDNVAAYSRDIMAIRYSLLPYFYTLMYNAHQTGATVLRALSWEFPRDPSLFGIASQFLVGPGLMVIPVLQQGVSTVTGVFPSGIPWYDWYSQKAVLPTSGSLSINAPQGHLPLYIRGGTILPQQAPGNTTYKSRQGRWTLLVALDSSGSASGSIYLDDGKSINPSQTQTVTLQASGNKLTATIQGFYNFVDYDVGAPPLSTVVIMGINSYNGNQAKFNGATVGTLYDPNNQKLVIQSGLDQQTAFGAWSQGWTLTWG